MKKGHKKLALLGAVLVVLLLAGQALAAGLEPSGPETAEKSCRYFYQLIQSDADPTAYGLYVERTKQDGVPLHAGYITLAAEKELAFQPGPGWSITSYDLSGGAAVSGPETGTTADGRPYLSFFWEAAISSTPVDDPASRRQLLGTLTIPEALTTEDVELLPFPQTQSGKKLVQDWQDQLALSVTDPDNADPESYLEAIRHTWRMPDLDLVMQGFYRGYYVPKTGSSTEDSAEDTETSTETSGEPITPPDETASSDEGKGSVPEDNDTPADQEGVDLTAGWLGFRIGAYAPERPVTLTFYAPGTEQVVAKASYSCGEGVGHFKTRIDFCRSDLEYKNEHDVPLDEANGNRIPDGTYDLMISKASHVTCTMKDLDFESGICVDLLGVYVELPCGDVDGDGDIRQDDRAKLTAPETYRTVYPGTNNAEGENIHDPEGEPYDLDGDHRVDQKDLAILIAPANYGKKNFTLNR